jgi:predicted nucleic acid-binding protein
MAGGGSAIVADASVVVGWLADEPTADRLEAAIRRSFAGLGMLVPSHFPFEVANALVMGERRGRWRPEHTKEWFEMLGRMRIVAELPPDHVALAKLAQLARDLTLTAYDAAYIELAARRRVPLLTFDSRLAEAAARKGVETLG